MDENKKEIIDEISDEELDEEINKINNRKSLFKKKEKKDKEPEKPVSEMTEKELKKYKYKKAKKRRKVMNSLMGFVIFCALLGCLSGFSIFKLVLTKTDVVLNERDLASSDSSLIYDNKGNQIAIVGEESRISYSYNKLPQVVIDAFVSIEDSRFFEHSGFDTPRFAKALLENIKSMSFSQGGSTITMQVIKNTYFAVDTIAEKSIGRKIQEIYDSIQISSIVPKEKIIELYINKVNYGSTSRGIQIASKYYFNKDCTDLSLVEAAMLAGIVNSPNRYNPYYHLEECQARTKDVLYQMHYHGYITDKEYEFARKVKIENLLCGSKNVVYGTGETITNQAYIDVVLAELEDVYNINPYSTPVKVYTAMDQNVQNYCDELSRGNVIEFTDEHVNTSLVCIQNYTGLIVGLCAGRDYDGVKLFNYAYDNRVNPGSTSKGVFTYPMAFEYCGLGTGYYIADEPTYWSGSRTTIKEEHGYQGEVSVQRAFTSSYNVCAVKMYRWVAQNAGVEAMMNYMKSIGIDKSTYTGINEQYAIGEQNFLISPIQLCAAESVILSKGLYTVPHTITRIEFINSTEEPITASFTSDQVLSEGAAWLGSYLQMCAVNGGTTDDWVPNSRLRYLKHSDYTVYGKTGTSLYDKTVRQKYGIPSTGAKDFLMVGGTNDYSFAFWMGYDTGQFIDNTTYISAKTRTSRVDCTVVNGLLDAVKESFGLPTRSNSRPSTVAAITHIKGLAPYTAPPEYAPGEMIVTSYVLSNFAQVQTYESQVNMHTPTSFDATYDKQTHQLSVSFSKYPEENALVIAPNTVTYPWAGKEYSGTRAYDPTWIDGVVEYNISVKDDTTGEINYYATNEENHVYDIVLQEGHSYTISGYYQYSINTNVRSTSLTKNIYVDVTIPDPPAPEEPEVDPIV